MRGAYSAFKEQINQGMTLLMLVARSADLAHHSIAQTILQSYELKELRGEDAPYAALEATDKAGNTALHYALLDLADVSGEVAAHRVIIAKAMMEKGANPLVRNAKGENCLINISPEMAAKYGLPVSLQGRHLSLNRAHGPA